MKKVYLLPNLFTAGSLFCGLLAIIDTFNAYSGLDEIRGDALLMSACWLILLAAVLDGIDGKIARLTRTQSAFGINFDSLADLVSFGVAPGLLIYSLLAEGNNRIAISVSILYTICGALRLARFNVQVTKEEKKSFTGLPIPGAAGVVVSSFIIFREINAPWVLKVLPVLMVVISYLMVSKINYPSFKNIELEKRKEFEYLFTAILLICLVVLLKQYKEYLIFAGFVGYAIYGIYRHFRYEVFAPKTEMETSESREQASEAHDSE